MPLPFDTIDLHIHTVFSDGVARVEDVAKTAKIKKLRTYAITDHYSEFCDLPKRMQKGQLKTYLRALEGLDAVKGVEADILSDGVSISDQTAELFDLVLGGLHRLHDTGFWLDDSPVWQPETFVEDVRITLIKAVETGLLDAIVHPTWLPENIRPRTKQLISKPWIESVVDTASDYGTAVEISGTWKVPDEAFVRECVRQGVKLCIGSDAHTVAGIGNTRYAVDLLEKVGVTVESILWPEAR